METDSSLYALGSILSIFIERQWYPVAYESCKLDKAELNYPMHEKELLLLIYSLKVWCHYLLGRTFIAYTDNSSITKLLTQSNLSGQQAQWIETLANFDVKIEYCLGKSNIVADALSRRADLYPRTVNSLTYIHNDITDQIIKAAKDNVEYQNHRIREAY